MCWGRAMYTCAQIHVLMWRPEEEAGGHCLSSSGSLDKVSPSQKPAISARLAGQ